MAAMTKKDQYLRIWDEYRKAHGDGEAVQLLQCLPCGSAPDSEVFQFRERPSRCGDFPAFFRRARAAYRGAPDGAEKLSFSGLESSGAKMMATMELDGYVARVDFDAEGNTFHGRIPDISDVVTFEGRNPAELLREFATSLRVYREVCREDGREPAAGG